MHAITTYRGTRDGWQLPTEWNATYQAIALEVMADKTLKSDRKREAEMIRRGVPRDADFVALVHYAKTATHNA